jgi:ParB family chromosome partitioning protein
MSTARRALGKGLDALIPGSRRSTASLTTAVNASGHHEINITDIRPNAHQPRKTFGAEKMDELIHSIKEKGIIEPIIVKETGDKFEIIAGERRFIAAQRAGLKKVPAIIKNVSAMEQLELALIENIIREELNPIEEAFAYKQLMEGFRYTQEQLSDKLGRPRTTVANMLRLLRLPDSLQNYVKSGELSEGHAKILLGIEDRNKQKAVAEQAVKKELSVRELEALLRESVIKKTKGKEKPEADSASSPEMKNVEKELKFKLGTKVSVKGSYRQGKIEIEYYSKEDFDRILDVMKIKP